MDRASFISLRFALSAIISVLSLGASVCLAQNSELTTELKPLSGYRVQLSISNNTTKPVTAFAVSIELIMPGETVPKAHGVRIVDSVLNYPRDREIMPGDTQVFEFGGVTRRDGTGSEPRVIFEAAVFADGSTFGDPGWAQRIIQDRRDVYLNISTAIQELAAARTASTPRSAIISRFESLKAENEHSARFQGIVGRYQGIIASLPFDDVLANLQHASVPGHGLAPLDAVESIMITELRTMQQRLYSSRPSVTTP